MTPKRVVYIANGAPDKPSVSIAKLADGTVTFNVKATGRSLELAAKRARKVFDGLAKQYEGEKG